MLPSQETAPYISTASLPLRMTGPCCKFGAAAADVAAQNAIFWRVRHEVSSTDTVHPRLAYASGVSTSNAAIRALRAWSAVALLAAEDRRLKAICEPPSPAITEPAGGGIVSRGLVASTTCFDCLVRLAARPFKTA
jgi:hypothetical protein